MLRALPLHASRGQLFLPEDLLAGHQVDPADIFAGRTTPALLDALAELRERVHTHQQEFERLLPSLSPPLRPAFLPLVLVKAYAARMDRPEYDPFKRPVEIAQWRRQWLLWRAARRLS